MTFFPEEFKAFMAPDGPIGEIFLAEHNEIFDPKYWRDIQKTHRSRRVP
jgi:isocitrate dehydrogenase kinase/phosphatase